ncbi:hypothetical protein CsSME_00038744 [Camellia sinensis var. sinensis]
MFRIASTPRKLSSFHRRIIASSHYLLRRPYAEKTVFVPSSHRLIIFFVVPTPRRLSSFLRRIVPSSHHLLRRNGQKTSCTKENLKEKERDEYHVKEESPQTNTSTNVDMRHVNYRSNMTGLVKLMKSTKFTQAQLGCLQQTPF